MRCIPIGSHMYFWFRVSSGIPRGQLAAQLPALLRSGVETPAEAALDWRSPPPPMSDARLTEADAELVLDEKAKAWQAAHHSGPAASAAMPETPALVPRPAKRMRLD